MKLIYVCDGNPSVYESQVLELLRYLSKKLDILLIQGFHNENDKISIMNKLSKYPEIKVAWVRTYKYYPFLMRKNYKAFRRIVKDFSLQKEVFHVRGELLGYVFKKLVKHDFPMMKVLIDIRGIALEEVSYKIPHIHGYRKLIFKFQQIYFPLLYQELFKPDNCKIILTCVSSCIIEYIKNRYSRCIYKMIVHPNIAGEQFTFSENKRQALRRKYGIAENELLAVCATGGNGVWQQDHYLIPFLIKAGIKVIHLSKIDYQIPGCITTVVPFNEMPDILSAADIGVLWREKDFINESASPSKFSEFARMGLFVIHNGSVKNAIEYIEENNSGCIIDKVSDFKKELLPSNLMSQRDELCKKGIRSYGLTNIGDSYIKTYLEMAHL